MKIHYLLVLLIVVPLFAGPSFVPSQAATEHGQVELVPYRSIRFVPLQPETLSYGGSFVNSLGIQGSGSPGPTDTYGFATLFVLSEFGITDPRKVHTVRLYPGTINGADFRLYVWDDASGVPNSHGTHLYSDMAVPWGSPWSWNSFDISTANVVLPDSFWIGVCLNRLTVPADWYLGYDASSPDAHTFGNLNGGAGDWVPMGNYGYGYIYGVEVVVDVPGGLAHDVGTTTYDSPTVVPLNTTYSPMATVHNYGENTETFDVTCTISPGGYSNTQTVTDLGIGLDYQVTFAPFTFASGFYDVTVFTQLAGDLQPNNDTITAQVEATDWLHYDDGVVASATAWNLAGSGWGVQFAVPHDLWVDSVACYIFDASWPSPGGNVATFELYDGISQPTGFRWDAFETTVTRGAWNYFEVDTTLTLYTAGDNIYFFYMQTHDYPNCPGLARDGGLDGPAMYWVNHAGVFSPDTPSSDWMMRVHVLGVPGISEWISATPDALRFRVTTVSTGDTEIEFTLPQTTKTDLQVYDATGRLCRTLVSSRLSAGTHNITSNLSLPAGVYFYNLKTESGINLTRKSLLVR